MRMKRASFTAWLNVHLHFCIKLCIMTTAMLVKIRQTLKFFFVQMSRFFSGMSPDIVPGYHFHFMSIPA